MTQEKFIKIDNIWIRDIQKLGHITFAVYVILLERMTHDGSTLVTLKHILDMLGVNRKTTQTVNKVKEALVMLQEREYIRFVSSFIGNESIEITQDIQVNDLLYCYIRIPEKKFTLMKVKELNKILSILDSEKKRALIAYFFCVLSHINNETKACFPSFEMLKKESRIGNDRTCILYNQELVSLGLIIYQNVGVKAGRNGKLRQGMNVYARPEHLKQLEEEVKRIRERDKYYFVTEQVKELVNQQRSVKQKINKLLQKREYDDLSSEEQKAVDVLNAKYEKLQSEHELMKKEYEELKKQHQKNNIHKTRSMEQQIEEYDFHDEYSDVKRYIELPQDSYEYNSEDDFEF